MRGAEPQVKSRPVVLRVLIIRSRGQVGRSALHSRRAGSLPPMSEPLNRSTSPVLFVPMEKSASAVIGHPPPRATMSTHPPGSTQGSSFLSRVACSSWVGQGSFIEQSRVAAGCIAAKGPVGQSDNILSPRTSSPAVPRAPSLVFPHRLQGRGFAKIGCEARRNSKAAAKPRAR